MSAYNYAAFKQVGTDLEKVTRRCGSARGSGLSIWRVNGDGKRVVMVMAARGHQFLSADTLAALDRLPDPRLRCGAC